ncbi:beta-1,4-mannosyl-glycoprotein 4-beta-N-acetylglucosaminyltransferase isoform X2 [Nematostella vectensis]|uniref:beta-1,4-mannosyl-glycoprotein 4-beta-N-acetylglucosaminyltransferase isoform X2 n=1 Tax=Nematostella vectensis TaxID=45351 RepID=UPI002077722C|nr:beta-1,4-mannosyl-glycoprotein 4-beta-N-acetylglucosaminyltransferase isoform X2 [Nematostella vectensis]XP_048585574.1 beta-1,4-mannosyl-glycoprotein 4-beta-N-acetylglucosaminyltransferase isoform X2 [Nematostella vectensis]
MVIKHRPVWRLLFGKGKVQYALLTAILVVLLFFVELHLKASSTFKPLLFTSTSGTTPERKERQYRPRGSATIPKHVPPVDNTGFSIFQPRVVTLLEGERTIGHFTRFNRTLCFSLGTHAVYSGRCDCKPGWYGSACSIPDCVKYSGENFPPQLLRVRKEARRIIYSAPFNIEFEMLEIIMNELHDIVDVFILVESHFSAFGTIKPVRLLPRLHRNYLRRFHKKIIYLYMDHFPTGARKNGWIADSYIRSFTGVKGLPQIRNVKPDDLFLVFDLDEIPSREALTFLRIHDGYPEPFGFRLRWSVFGFYWKNSRATQITAGCSVGMLTQVHGNMSNRVRDIENGVNRNLSPEFRAYSQQHSVRAWFLGDVDHFAGWHCSSCMDVHGIWVKYTSAQNGDFPRWGSYHDKMDIKNLRNMVRNGKWFDGNAIGDGAMATRDNDNFFAPKYMLDHFEKYEYLLSREHLHAHEQTQNTIEHYHAQE